MPASTVSSGLPGSVSQASPGSSRRRPAKRYERRRAASSCTPASRNLAGPAGRASASTATGSRPQDAGIGWELVHICMDDATTDRRRRGGRGEEGDERGRLPPRALAHLRAHGIRIERVMGDNGSAYVSRARARLQDARDQTPAHPPLPSAHERQSRALHPHPARRLGLRRHLGQLPRAAPRPHRLARLLQSTPTTRLP